MRSVASRSAASFRAAKRVIAEATGREAAMWRLHNLLRPDSIAWDAMLRRHPGFADSPLVAEWAQFLDLCN